jgi:hypothetical protein
MADILKAINNGVVRGDKKEKGHAFKHGPLIQY